MKLSNLMAVFAILFLIPLSASATCITPQQAIMLDRLFNNTNMTAGDRDAFFGMFDSLCNRSYTMEETNAKIADVYTINSSIKAYMDNYTAWYQEQTNMANALNAMTDVLNASNIINGMGSTLDNKIITLEDRWDERINDIIDNNKKLVAQAQLVSLDQNVTIRLNGMENNIRRDFMNAQSSNTGMLAFLIVIVGVAVYFVMAKRSEARRRADARSTAPYVDRSRRPTQATMDELAEDEDVRASIKATQQAQLDREKALLKEDVAQEQPKLDMKAKLKKQLEGKP